MNQRSSKNRGDNKTDQELKDLAVQVLQSRKDQMPTVNFDDCILSIQNPEAAKLIEKMKKLTEKVKNRLNLYETTQPRRSRRTVSRAKQAIWELR